jgi:hypothetical protein
MNNGHQISPDTAELPGCRVNPVGIILLIISASDTTIHKKNKKNS